MNKIKQILLIDDNDIDNYIHEQLIKRANIAEVITVKNSAEDALQYLASINGEFPDIIFLDIRMPAMDGFGFLKNFEAFHAEKKSACKIFMLTSSSDPKDILLATQNPHVKKYLNKPLHKINFEIIFSDYDSAINPE